jgi:hypothetical protein
MSLIEGTNILVEKPFQPAARPRAVRLAFMLTKPG